MEPKIKRELDRFFEKYRLIKYKRGELIYRPGDVFSHISYIKSGYVRLYTISKDGEEVTIDIFKPVFYFSLMFALADVENPYYFEAITPVELWRAPKEEALQLIESDHEILLELYKCILRGFRKLLTNIECSLSGNANTKVASILVSLANSFGKKDKGSTVINIATTHEIIASLTGLTRETVSIQMRGLEKKGLVSRRGQLLAIKDLERLKEESSFCDA